MRIASISIKNFRSISEINDLYFLDKGVTCIIGRNGSGKSNLLYAVLSLKYDQYLLDRHIHEKPNKEKEIIISAEIDLEDKDEELLLPFKITLRDIKSFRVVVKKKVGENPERIFQISGFGKDFQSQIISDVRQVEKLFASSDVFKNIIIPSPETISDQSVQETETPEQIKEKEEKNSLSNLLIKIKNTQQELSEKKVADLDKGLVLQYVNNLNQLLMLSKLSQDISDQIKTIVQRVKVLLDFNEHEFIEKYLWSKLEIAILDLKEYKVETCAKRSDLKVPNKHPFLSDLLKLTGKNVEAFNAVDAELVNIQNDAENILSEKISDVWGQHKIKFTIQAQNDKIFLSFETPQKRNLGLDDLSDGEKWFLQFYTKLAIARDDKKQILWLFDEPGQSLHATSQIDLKAFFEVVSITSQIIYTSHQPMMIQWHRLDRIQVADNTVGQGTTITSRFWKDEEMVSPLKEALGLFVGEQMLSGNQHVVVEGMSDYIHLQGWLLYFQRTRDAKHWQEDNSQLKRTYIPAGGRECIPLYLSFLVKKTKGKISSLAIPDSQEDAEKVKDGIKFIDPLSGSVKSFSELAGDPKLKDIEEIYQPGEFLVDVRDFYSQTYPEVKINDDFFNPKAEQLKSGIIEYINSYLDSRNPKYFEGKKLELDKPGVAMHIYLKLNRSNVLIYSKATEKRFEKVFKEINSIFNS
jgi:predicted ATPase